MMILKAKEFGKYEALTKFVNDNNISRENIINIVFSGISVNFYTIFYYGDVDTKEKTGSIWD